MSAKLILMIPGGDNPLTMVACAALRTAGHTVRDARNPTQDELDNGTKPFFYDSMIECTHLVVVVPVSGAAELPLWAASAVGKSIHLIYEGHAAPAATRFLSIPVGNRHATVAAAEAAIAAEV